MSNPRGPEWSDPTQAGYGYPPNTDPAYSGQYSGQYWGPTYQGYGNPMTRPTEQLPPVDGAAVQFVVHHDVCRGRRRGGQRLEVFGLRVHGRGEFGDIGEVAQSLDTSRGRACADRHQHPALLPDPVDALPVGLGGDGAGQWG